MVLRRWAIVRTVQSSNCVRIVDWMSVSVSRSTAAVASSRTRILVFLSRALARHTSWRCPRLQRENPKRHMSCSFVRMSAEYLRPPWRNNMIPGCTWGFLLPPNIRGWACPAGWPQRSWDERAPVNATRPHRCRCRRGPGSSGETRRRAQGPSGRNKDLVIYSCVSTSVTGIHSWFMLDTN